MSHTSEWKRSPWDEMLARGRAMKKVPSVDVGYPADGKMGRPWRNGSKHKPFVSMAEIAYIMSIQEFGSSKGIPARPFMGPALDRNKNRITDLQNRIGLKILKGEYSIKEGLDTVGKFMAELIKTEIRNLRTPALSPVTIRRKHSDQLLVDTGQAVNSVTWVSRVNGKEVLGGAVVKQGSRAAKQVKARRAEVWGKAKSASPASKRKSSTSKKQSSFQGGKGIPVVKGVKIRDIALIINTAIRRGLHAGA